MPHLSNVIDAQLPLVPLPALSHNSTRRDLGFNMHPSPVPVRMKWADEVTELEPSVLAQINVEKISCGSVTGSRPSSRRGSHQQLSSIISGNRRKGFRQYSEVHDSRSALRLMSFFLAITGNLFRRMIAAGDCDWDPAFPCSILLYRRLRRSEFRQLGLHTLRSRTQYTHFLIRVVYLRVRSSI